MIQTSVLPLKSLVIFGNLRQSLEIFRNVRKRLSGLQTTFGAPSEIFGKLSKRLSLVCLYNKQNNTWLLIDMDISLLKFNSISHEWAQRTLEKSSWTLKEKFLIYTHHLLPSTSPQLLCYVTVISAFHWCTKKPTTCFKRGVSLPFIGLLHV